LDEVLNSSLEMPISSRSQFLDLRLKLAQTLDEFLTFAQRKPFAFDFDGEGKTIDEIIADRKSWYNPEYDKQTKEEYDSEIEKEFAEERLWQDRLMFDDKAILVINEHFPLEVMMQAVKSPALPDYLQKRFALSVLVRALLLQNYPAVQKIAPEIIKFEPDLEIPLNQILAAAPNRKKYHALYLILKHQKFSPYVPSGLGSPQEQYTYATRWWCAPSEDYYDTDSDKLFPRGVISRPAFLTAAQSNAAKTEMKKLKEIGDAPQYLAEKVFEWARMRPGDKLVPESIHIVYEANDWDKYGCGGNQELRKEAADVLRTKYPSSEWTRAISDEPEQ